MVTINQNYTIDKHIQKRKCNPNTTIKVVIKSQKKRTIEIGKKKTYKNRLAPDGRV